MVMIGRRGLYTNFFSLGSRLITSTLSPTDDFGDDLVVSHSLPGSGHSVTNLVKVFIRGSFAVVLYFLLFFITFGWHMVPNSMLVTGDINCMIHSWILYYPCYFTTFYANGCYPGPGIKGVRWLILGNHVTFVLRYLKGVWGDFAHSELISGCSSERPSAICSSCICYHQKWTTYTRLVSEF